MLGSQQFSICVLCVCVCPWCQHAAGLSESWVKVNLDVCKHALAPAVIKSQTARAGGQRRSVVWQHTLKVDSVMCDRWNRLTWGALVPCHPPRSQHLSAMCHPRGPTWLLRLLTSSTRGHSRVKTPPPVSLCHKSTVCRPTGRPAGSVHFPTLVSFATC